MRKKRREREEEEEEEEADRLDIERDEIIFIFNFMGFTYKS
jgi:hypothetical protein